MTSRRQLVGMHVHERGDATALAGEHVAHGVPGRTEEAEVGEPLVVVELGQIAAAAVGDEHDDDGGRTEVAADLQRRPHRGAGRAADQDAFFARDASRGEERVAVADRDHSIDDRRIVGAGPEVFADAFDEVRATGAAGVHRTFGVGADDLDRRVLRFQVASDAGDGAAGADAGDEMRDASTRSAATTRDRC